MADGEITISNQSYKGDGFEGNDTVITKDNIVASKIRYKAMMDYQEGKATPDQVALLEEGDRILQEAMANRNKN
jgi:hypothetical protein